MADKQKIKEERMQKFNHLAEEMSDEGYTQESAVISVLKANVMTFVTAIPLMAVFVLLFRMLHHNAVIDLSLWIPIAVLASVPVHELLHGLGWFPFCKKNWKQSIHFGVMWSSLTPYCHCSEPLSVGHYYSGLLMPFMVLGVLPSAVALVTGSGFLLSCGILGILLAGGDLTIACVLMKYIGKTAKVLDHPSECGCAVFKKT